MNEILIDTNIYSHALKGTAEIVETLQRVSTIGFSAISIGELLSGFKGGAREKENRQKLREFLDAPRVKLFPIDETTADFYADILNRLRTAGKPIPTNDIWIGAVAMQHGLPLYTKDGHFAAISGLLLV